MPGLHVSRQLGVPKKRSFVRVAGVAPDISIVPFNHKLSTLERAVKERVFLVKSLDGSGELVSPPRPEPGVFSSRLEPTLSLLKTFLPSTAPVSYQQFVDSYKGRKKGVYERALQDLRLGGSSPAEDAQVKVFIKFEKTDRTTKVDPVPRVISPRSPKYNLRVGRFLKPLEERMFKSLGRLFKHRTVMKGMDVTGVAKCLKEKWDMFSDPVAVGLDASRFDQHVSLDALRWEHSVYLDCFKRKKDRETLARWLKLQEVNSCVGYAEDGKLSYKVEGTRMSGDMNTSLGNCVLMCSMIHAYLQSKGINGQLANNGDDCVVFMERRDLKRFSDGCFEWFLGMGFNMAIEQPVYDFAGLEFCQCKPVFDGTSWRMCRNPRTAIAKDAVLLKSNVNDNFFRLWLNAVGSGGLSIAGGMPIFQAFYQMYVRNGITSYRSRDSSVGLRTAEDYNEIMPWFMREQALSGGYKSMPVTPEARSSFYDAFGVTPDEQIELEKYYASCSIGEFGRDWFCRPVFDQETNL